MRKIILVVVILAFHTNTQGQSLPEAPKSKIDGKIFWTEFSLLAGAKNADAVTTRIGLDDHGGSETNPLFGSHPTAARQSAVNAALFAGQISLLHYTERNSRPYIRWGGRVYIGLVIANHVQLAACAAKDNANLTNQKRCRMIGPF